MECDGFEWDDDKAEENPLNHDGVTFEEATAVFANDNTVELFDESHSEEEGRYYAIGFSLQGRLLLVSFIPRGKNIRIISARLAKGQWEEFYEEHNR
jgi:uncharacterized DUF497 family protein